jgi:hypothetical protein
MKPPTRQSLLVHQSFGMHSTTSHSKDTKKEQFSYIAAFDLLVGLTHTNTKKF